MHYVMSDIHGELFRYQSMLEQIQFSDADTLYVLGDVIDRHPDGVAILEDIMSRQNVIMLLGNHEQMCLDTLGTGNVLGARKLWVSNGGNVTYREMCYHISAEKRHQILRYLYQLPDHLDIEVKGNQFHLVHGFPGSNTEARIWTRPKQDTVDPMPGKTVILGHTPVPFLYSEDRMDEVLRAPQKIFRGKGFIGIDCCCGNLLPTRRLACLRLEDMREFYA